MGYRVIFSTQADRDLEAVVAFLAQQSSAETAERIGRELLAIMLALADLPRRGGRVRRRPGLRKLTHRHYQLFYQIHETDQVVQIVRIWDGRRDPNSLRL